MTILNRAAAVVLAASIAAPVFAQTTPARPAAAAVQPARPSANTPSSPGPVLPGVCVLDEQRAIASSAAGRAYTARLQTLAQQVEAELRPQQTALQTEVTTFQSQQASLTAEQRNTRGTALQNRADAFQTLAGTRQRELQATQERQLRRIATEMQPVVAQVYVARGCGLLMDGGSVVYANPAMNITDQVITGLNARLPTLTFDRERAPAAPAAAQTPATRR